jgi:anti-sigma factor RsiW
MRGTFDDRSCARAREHVSLRLDGELSELEGASLHAHLSRCTRCSAFASELEALTDGLRAAPLEQPPFKVALPRRRSVAVRRVLPAAGVAAAAAAVAVFTSSVQTRSPQTPSASARAPAPASNEVVENRALRRLALLPGVGRSVADSHGLRVPGDV